MKPLDWRLWTPLGVLALIVTGCLLGPVVVDADAIPAFSPGERRHRVPVVGDPVTAWADLPGCTFASRCPAVTSLCRLPARLSPQRGRLLSDALTG